MASYVERLIGAAKLDAAVYEDVEADSSAMGQAIATVVLSSVAAGIGAYSDAGVRGMAVITLTALAGWFLWAGLVYLVGVKIMPAAQTKSNMGELLRTIGFSSSPGLIRLVGIIPALSGLVTFVASLWMLAAMIVGVRQALDLESTGRAAAVCLIGFLVYLVAIVSVVMLLGVGAAALGVEGA